MKTLFITWEGIVLCLLDDMVVLAHDGPTNNMTIEMPNPSMEGEFALMSQEEGV